jgi:hypothetical protein
VVQTRCVDTRAKTFVAEATDRLRFLGAEYGFTGPEIEGQDEDGGYPLLRTVRYRREGVTIEASLVLSYMAEEYVVTRLVRDDPPGATHHSEIGHNTAHTGYQMRRALELQAGAVRDAIRGQLSRDGKP